MLNQPKETVLNFIKSNSSRQEYEPILGQLVDKVYAEPLHNGNNAWQQLHEAMLSHSISKVTSQPHVTTLPNCPSVHFHFILQHLRKWGQLGCIKSEEMVC